MTTKKRTYPAEFKQEAVRLWETTGKSVREIERELGITHGLLNKWKRKLKDEGASPEKVVTELSQIYFFGEGRYLGS